MADSAFMLTTGFLTTMLRMEVASLILLVTAAAGASVPRGSSQLALCVTWSLTDKESKPSSSARLADDSTISLVNSWSRVPMTGR